MLVSRGLEYRRFSMLKEYVAAGRLGDFANQALD
jgi:hypothetical protein